MRIKIREIEGVIIRDIVRLQSEASVDKRWLAIARTDIEKGFMSLRKALEYPFANIKINEKQNERG